MECVEYFDTYGEAVSFIEKLHKNAHPSWTAFVDDETGNIVYCVYFTPPKM